MKISDPKNSRSRLAILGVAAAALVVVLAWPTLVSGSTFADGDDDDDDAMVVIPERMTIGTGGRGPVTVLCDDVNGNLIYLYQDAVTRSAVSMAVVPGGC